MSTIDHSQIIKQGFLVKKGAVWKTWKKRWFVIQGKMMYYYKKEKDVTPLGAIPLSEKTTAKIAENVKKANCFEVDVPGKRTYYICGQSEDDRQKWIETILSTIRASNQPKVSLEDFDIVSVLGRGTYGKVQLVQKKDNGTYYAMKSLHKGRLAISQQVEQTLAEKDVFLRARHPFLVSLHYSFQSDEKLFMILDYANGGELFFHLRKEGKFSNERVRLYAAEIVLALEYLHKLDIVYRDLKLENILLSDDGHIKITDFGLVKTNISEEKNGTKTICGTPEYMAPEVLLEIGYSKSVDWWSLGVLMYEMLVGLPPFYSEDMNVLYQKILRQPLKFPPDVPELARDLIKKLLIRNPKKRIGSSNEDSLPIKSHPYFAIFDWEKVYKKEIEPSFKPEIKEVTDISNFDQEFTKEKGENSVPDVSVMGRISQKAFDGFTFMENVDGLGDLNNLD
ncbi:non-specific serine/threonine protein kinase [Anaeramoeba ignava]|uniref:non-specific serine/threonine protein kinase n=1 Tax=Anaeramoeba ignava TaxID=1746090 RepID=A0A9Q0LF41_ANAIG|nr:non-specific serine/threonine protein kinase [Anaeramoeba ignava]|eukprot:Anaeramoba_ignava/a349695_247.p1 GENE.a349695_247~~a349695_247.p1  ORF type:complete len:451 (-),score=123.20 a349695_247:1243-2595(-)